MLYNSTDYPNPLDFNPDRFLVVENGVPRLRTDVRDPEDIVFGFGRRCEIMFIMVVDSLKHDR